MEQRWLQEIVAANSRNIEVAGMRVSSEPLLDLHRERRHVFVHFRFAGGYRDRACAVLLAHQPTIRLA